MEFFDSDTRTYIQPEVSYYQAAQPLPSRLIFSPFILSNFPNTLRKLKVKELPRIFQGTRLYRMGDNVVYFQGTMGAPATVMFLETLIALGIREVIFLGFAGGIEHTSIGDRLLVTEAIRLEGTSYHYLPSTSLSKPSKPLHDQIRVFFSKRHCAISEGKICSTDAPFRETFTLIDELRPKGVLAIDMEVAAVFAVAQFRTINSASLVIISDELREGKWSRINSDAFTRSYISSFELLLEFFSDRV
ncbi:MAG: nucleoside phosphorylase [Candidatus Heimdallarchaeota archaeon]